MSTTKDGVFPGQAKGTRQVYTPSELPEEMWADIDSAAPSEQARALDHLMDE